MPFSSHFGPTSELLIARPVLTIGRVGFIGRIALFYYRFLISGSEKFDCDTHVEYVYED